MECLQACAKRLPAHSHKKCRDARSCLGNETWAVIVGRSLKNLDLSASPPLELNSQLAYSSVCENYKELMKSHFESVEREISEWTEFPFNL